MSLHNVYILISTVSNRTYVGYAKDPFKRLRQHNGEITGGAKRTRKGRPWQLVLWVTGFPYEKTALQFEFCIQHTKRYRRTNSIPNKIWIMKQLLGQEQICSTAPANSELKLAVFFTDISYWKLWNSHCSLKKKLVSPRAIAIKTVRKVK